MTTPVQALHSVRGPVRLVVLASEQLWPNIASMCFFGTELPYAWLERVYIYHTDDERRSAQPARALARIAREHFGVTAELRQGGMQPVDVTRCVGRWLKSQANATWLLNATGGTKLMTAGILRFVGEPNTFTVYGELSGTWYVLERAEDGRAIRAVPWSPPRSITDSVPVRTLIEALWAGDGAVIEYGEDVPDLPVDEIARHLPARADLQSPEEDIWTVAFRQAGQRPSKQPGFLFEMFLAACIRQLGLKNPSSQIATNVKRSRQGRVDQEVDIVVNCNGRVHIIDCKLVSKERPISEEYRQADATRRELGGLAAKYLFVRPNRVIPDVEKSLLRSRSLDVLDARDFCCLCENLARFLGLTNLTDVARRVDAALRHWQSMHALPGFCQPRTTAGRQLSPYTSSDRKVRILEWFQELHRANGWETCIVDLGTHYVIVAAVPDGVPRDVARQRVEVMLRRHAAGLRDVSYATYISGSGRTVTVTVSGSKATQLVESLPEKFF